MMLARSYNTLGMVYFASNQIDQAEESWAKGLALMEKLTEHRPDIVDYQVMLASNQSNLGVVHLRCHRFKEAETAFTKGLAINQKLSAKNPNVTFFQNDIASGQANLADVYAAMGLHEKAAESLRQATIIRKKLAADHPANIQYRVNLAASSMSLAQLNIRAGKLDEAMKAYRQAEEDYDNSPPVVEIAQEQYHLAEGYKGLAMRYKTETKLEEANIAYERLLAVMEKVSSGCPARMDFALALGSTYYEFGFFLNEQGKSEEALSWFAKGIQALQDLRKKQPGDAKVQRYLLETHWARARALVQLKRPKEAFPDYDRAIDLDTGVSRNALEWERILTQARAGESDQATSQAEKRLQDKNRPAAELFQAARVFAVASVTIRDDASHEKAEKEKRADQFAGRAVALLQQIQDTGFFRNNLAAVAQLQRESDFPR
jgi:tetratricopeptide (TPR) repeat protein